MKNKINLGGHPAANIAMIAAGIFVLSAIVVGIAFLMNHVVGVIFLLGMGFIWLFAAGPVLVGTFIAALINARDYRKAKRLVAAGELNASYFGRNNACKGIAIVDESNKRLYLNGQLYDFSNIKSIRLNWTAVGRKNTREYYIEVVLKSGAAPLQKVSFDGENSANNFYHRLANTLNFG
jgi:hypothetical protein